MYAGITLRSARKSRPTTLIMVHIYFWQVFLHLHGAREVRGGAAQTHTATGFLSADLRD